jgi:hypothetical protein
VEPKLLGDIENLKTFALLVGDSLPIDYYKVRADFIIFILLSLLLVCTYFNEFVHAPLGNFHVVVFLCRIHLA